MLKSKQKLIKLSDTRYIIVDNSENQSFENKSHFYDDKVKLVGQYFNGNIEKSWKKITHSTEPLCFLDHTCVVTHTPKPDWSNIKYIYLKMIQSVLYDYDIENMAEKDRLSYYSLDDQSSLPYETGYIRGFEAHEVLTKDKLFTVEQVKKYHNVMCLHGNIKGEEYLQSLLPKTEWDIEFDKNGRIILL